VKTHHVFNCFTLASLGWLPTGGGASIHAGAAVAAEAPGMTSLEVIELAAAQSAPRPKLALDDLSDYFAAALSRGEESGAAAAHVMADVALAVQDALAEDGAAPTGLVATLAAIAGHALDGPRHEVLLLELCLCSLAELTGAVRSDDEEVPLVTVPDDVARLALRVLRLRLSTASTGHAAAVLMAAARPLRGWAALLGAWRAEAADGSDEASEAAAADAGAFCERILTLVGGQFASDTSTATDGSAREAPGGSDPCWTELQAREAQHQLESALTSCVQLVGFVALRSHAKDGGGGGKGGDSGADEAGGDEGGVEGGLEGGLDGSVGGGGNEAAARAAAASVSIRAALLARLYLLACGREPRQRPSAASGGVCARVGESAETVVALLLTAAPGGWERPLLPPRLADLSAAVAESLAARGAERDAFLLSGMLYALARVDEGEPARRAVRSGALALAAHEAERAAAWSEARLLALGAVAAACVAAPVEALTVLGAESLGFLAQVAGGGAAGGEAEAEAAAEALEALGWGLQAAARQRTSSSYPSAVPDGSAAAAASLLSFAGEGVLGDAALRAWAVDSICQLASDPAIRPALIEGGALQQLAKMAAVEPTAARAAGVAGGGRGGKAAAPPSGAIAPTPKSAFGRALSTRAGLKPPGLPSSPARAGVSAAEAAAEEAALRLSQLRVKRHSAVGRTRIGGWNRERAEAADSSRASSADKDARAEAPPTGGGFGGWDTETSLALPPVFRAKSELGLPRNVASAGAAGTAPPGAQGEAEGAPPVAWARGRRVAHFPEGAEPPSSSRGASRSSVSGEISWRSRSGESRVAALTEWLTFADAAAQDPAAYRVPTSTLRYLCRLAEGPARDTGEASLALAALRSLLGGRCAESAANAEWLRELVLTMPRRAPEAVDPTACVGAMLSLLDETATDFSDASLLAPRLLRILQAAVDHRSRMRVAGEMGGPLIERFVSVARFVAAAGMGGAAEGLAARAVELARSLCALSPRARASFLSLRPALFAAAGLLGHPAENVQAPAMQLLLSLSSSSRAAAAELVAAGAVQAVLDCLARAQLDPSPEAQANAAAASKFLQNLVERDRGVLRLVMHHPACDGVAWPEY